MSLVAATIKVLSDQNLASGRVYGVKLPESEHANMPRTAIVVRASGGGATLAGHYMKTGDQRLDIKCFGATEWEASRLEGQVAAFLQGFRQQAVTITDPDDGPVDVMVGWYSQTGGPNDLVDPDTDWPVCLAVWTVWGDRYAGGSP